MQILQWIASLFGMLRRIKLHVKAEADLIVGRDSDQYDSDGSGALTVTQKDRTAKRIARRKGRKDGG